MTFGGRLDTGPTIDGRNQGAGGARKGLILGSSVNTSPDAPTQHVLMADIKLEKLPFHHLPIRHVRISDLIEDVSSMLLKRQVSQNRAILKNVYNAIIQLTNAVSPQPQSIIADLSLANPAFRRHCAKTNESSFTKAQVRHPYDILNIVKLIPTLRSNIYGEKYILELYVSEILSEYAKSIRKNALYDGFMFAKEAVSFFQNGHMQIPLLAKIIEERERIDLINSIFSNYYHAKWYYYFSVIAREPPINDGKLFMCAYHAMYFLSSVREDGAISRTPKSSLMPKVDEIAFYLRRDASASGRIANDREFAAKVSDILNSLPRR